MKELSSIRNQSSLATLFIGGGTPTALPVKSISILIHNIFNHFNFINNYEATIEANPGTAVSLNPEHISTYKLTVEKGTELDSF